MIARWPRLARRSLALGLLAGLALLLAILVGLPLWDRYDELGQAIAEERQTLGRLEAVLAGPAPAPEAGPAAAGDLFLVAESETAAVAALQARLGGLAEQAGIRLQSAAELPVRERGGLRLIGVRLQMSADLAATQRLLHAVEAARPVLIIDTVQWRAAPFAEPTAGGGVVETAIEVLAALEVPAP